MSLNTPYTPIPMLIRPLLTFLLAFLVSGVMAQRPLSVYAEAGLHTRFLNVPYQVRAGLQWGRDDVALEYGMGGGEQPGRHYGIRYRRVLHPATAQTRLVPFIQAGASLAFLSDAHMGPVYDFRSVNVDLAPGLRVAVWKGLVLSAHVGLRYADVRSSYDQTILYTFGPKVHPAGGIGVAYALPLRKADDPQPSEQPFPRVREPRHRHEIGLDFSQGYVANFLGYTDFRLRYAYRLRPHWDLRAAVDLPAWPITHLPTASLAAYWRPGVYAGARFWAFPGMRTALFVDAGLMGTHRYLPWISDYIAPSMALQPEVGMGLRTAITSRFGVELSAYLRQMPVPGMWGGTADNGVRLGLSYRFGGGREDVATEPFVDWPGVE